MKQWSVRLAVLVAILAAGASMRAEDKPAAAVHRNVKAEEFERLTKEPGTVVLDVRTPKEYADGHLKDAVLIDWNRKDFVDEVKKLDKGKTYLVYCAVGGRSAKACSKLDGLDFPKVVNLEGGIGAWKRAGKPIEK